MSVTLADVYIRSEDVVSRIIEDELIIVPLVSGIGESDDDLYTLNETGRAIWSRIDGEKSLGQIVEELLDVFEADNETVQQDLLGLVEELVSRKLLIVR